MEYRTLDLILVSAKGLKKASFIGKMDVYAVAFISGTTGKVQKLRTPIDKNGHSDPTWNFPMKFTIDEAAGLQNRLTLVINIKAVGIFGDKNLGEVHVPIKDLMDGVKTEGKAMQIVNYQVRTPSGKPKGVLSLSYEFGEKFSGKAEEPVTAYPLGMAVGPSSGYPPPYVATGGHYPPQPQAGYAYQQQQQPGFGSYPPPPPPGYGGYPPQPFVQPPRKNNSGMGFGTGLLGGALGGLLLGEIVSDATNGGGCGGGGCGGGGCGGGCGGGGCGGF